MTSTQEIKLNYSPRPWQVRAHMGLRSVRTGLLICSRQVGKTVCALNHLSDLTLSGPPNCNSVYICPTANQARRIAWPTLLEIVRPLGKMVKISHTELTIKFPGNRTIYILGAESGENIRGLSARHCVCDERDNISDSFWRTVMLPVFNDWGLEAKIIYIGTLSGGDSLLWNMYLKHKDDPTWFCMIVDGKTAQVFSQEYLDLLLQEMGTIAFEREIMCNPHAAVENAVLGEEMTTVANENRITRVPYRPGQEVHTSWDLGIRDLTTCWGFMLVGRAIEYIFYKEWTNSSAVDIIGELLQVHKNYRWGEVILPHDGKNRDAALGYSVKKAFTDRWPGYVHQYKTAPSPTDTISAARINLPRCYFDEANCDKGIMRLKSASYVVTPKTEMRTDRIKHDVHSHGLDGFRLGVYHVESGNSSYQSNNLSQGQTEVETVGSMDSYDNINVVGSSDAFL